MNTFQAILLCLVVLVLFGIKWIYRNSAETKYVQNPLYTERQNEGLEKTHNVLRTIINVMQALAVVVFLVILFIYVK